jgi:hypothetical protein
MTLAPHFQYIDLWSMELKLAVNIQGNGLVRLQLHAAYSERIHLKF